MQALIQIKIYLCGLLPDHPQNPEKMKTNYFLLCTVLLCCTSLNTLTAQCSAPSPPPVSGGTIAGCVSRVVSTLSFIGFAPAPSVAAAQLSSAELADRLGASPDVRVPGQPANNPSLFMSDLPGSMGPPMRRPFRLLIGARLVPIWPNAVKSRLSCPMPFPSFFAACQARTPPRMDRERSTNVCILLFADYSQP